MAGKIEGRCLCSAVRYRSEAEQATQIICHCKIRQKSRIIPWKLTLIATMSTVAAFASGAHGQNAVPTNQSFAAPESWAEDFTRLSGWRSDRHPQMLGDVNGDGRQDLVGFGEAGVYLALSSGTAFTPPQFAVPEFGYSQGWRNDRHIRLLADINGDGKSDIVAFGDDGVWTALSTGSGFGPPHFVMSDLGFNQGWRVDEHVRLLADINGDGRNDITAFGADGVFFALADGAGGFGPLTFDFANFGTNQGWRVSRHVRALGDINGDDRADIVAFGDDGVWTALADGEGFAPPNFVLPELGFNQGWRGEGNPRFLEDVDRDGNKDIIGFGEAGVWTARSTGDGGFAPSVFVFAEFGSNSWGRPRFVTDLNGDGYLDLIAMEVRITGPDQGSRRGVWRALGGPIRFGPVELVLLDFPNDHFALGDVDGDGNQDLVAFDFTDFNVAPRLARTMVSRTKDSSPQAAPLAPSNPRVSEPTTTSLAIAWTNNAPDARYFRYVYPTNALQTNATHAVLYGLEPDKSYCFTVRAVSWWGVSRASPSACGRTASLPLVPWIELYVQKVDLSPTYFPTTGDTLTIEWFECAAGNQASGPYNLKVLHDGEPIYTVRRPSLGIGCHNSEAVTAVARFGTHAITVSIDTDNEVTEVSGAEGNNTTTSEYGGD